MKISRGFVLAALMTLAAGPVFAAFNLSDMANAVSGAQDDNGGDAMAAATPQAAALLDTLGSLNVTPEQAIGGAGAMLGLAKNRLSPTDYSQLSQSVPGLDLLSGSNALGGLVGLGAMLGQNGNAMGLDGLLGNVKTVRDLDAAFSALGMDSGMIGQFAPLMLQFMGQQGVAGSLLQNLGGIWGAGS